MHQLPCSFLFPVLCNVVISQDHEIYQEMTVKIMIMTLENQMSIWRPNFRKFIVHQNIWQWTKCNCKIERIGHLLAVHSKKHKEISSKMYRLCKRYDYTRIMSVYHGKQKPGQHWSNMESYWNWFRSSKELGARIHGKVLKLNEAFQWFASKKFDTCDTVHHNRK